MISRSDVQKIAALAKLSLDNTESERLTGELDQILKYVEKLDALDLKKVEVTSHAVEVTNVFREDEVKPCTIRDEVLNNAPESEDNLFKVPRII